ncbi:relaxase/mobilization nuclease domain-containing protein [Mucilaginibacter sp. L196]|uniref:relaxase/mobilization nuclease domain-containing protein n=1 Tax=Mucilaginibacter sp. L196 TaxID=1641870 RepID=UPI00131DC78F|nr:relaxase/mobilization nuclease domain-containing protein [Mucilaginibacter sp. L196]
MIVKFLRPASSFKGVGYSFAKMLLDKGELMEVKNFGALAGLSNPRAEDYVNYLEAVTDKNKRIVYPQLHVTISTKGRDHTKSELTAISEKWLEGMGYGSHPYLIIFHKDTQNNHVHLVSTRIGRDGKKVKDSYERVKGYQVLNEVMGLDENLQVQKDKNHALTYNFSSRAQFMMLLELKGYTLNLKDGVYQIFKFGKKLDSLPVEKVDERIADHQQNKKRLEQLRAIIEKYRPNFNPALFPETSKLAGGGEGKTTGYNSELAGMLQRDFGLQIFFHAKDGKQPYGYTVIDHAKKAVYKGGDLMPLAEFIKPAPEQANHTTINKPVEKSEFFESEDFEPPQINSDESENWYADDMENYHTEFTGFQAPGIYVPSLRIDISDDIDDEQINGRNRKRKRKARTNTR